MDLKLPDLAGLKQEEIEKLCTLLESGSDENWKDGNGIRFLTQSVKVSTEKWREHTTDCASIVAGEKGFPDVFVFAYTLKFD